MDYHYPPRRGFQSAVNQQTAVDAQNPYPTSNNPLRYGLPPGPAFSEQRAQVAFGNPAVEDPNNLLHNNGPGIFVCSHNPTLAGGPYSYKYPGAYAHGPSAYAPGQLHGTFGPPAPSASHYYPFQYTAYAPPFTYPSHSNANPYSKRPYAADDSYATDIPSPFANFMADVQPQMGYDTLTGDGNNTRPSLNNTFPGCHSSANSADPVWIENPTLSPIYIAPDEFINGPDHADVWDKKIATCQGTALKEKRSAHDPFTSSVLHERPGAAKVKDKGKLAATNREVTMSKKSPEKANDCTRNVGAKANQSPILCNPPASGESRLPSGGDAARKKTTGKPRNNTTAADTTPSAASVRNKHDVFEDLEQWESWKKECLSLLPDGPPSSESNPESSTDSEETLFQMSEDLFELDTHGRELYGPGLSSTTASRFPATRSTYNTQPEHDFSNPFNPGPLACDRNTVNYARLHPGAAKVRAMIKETVAERGYDSIFELFDPLDEDTQKRREDQFSLLQRLSIEALCNLENVYVQAGRSRRTRIRRVVKALLEEFMPGGPHGLGWAF